MKKKVLTVSVTAIITILILTISAVKLLPPPANKHFGLLQEVYRIGSGETEITDCEGDTDILKAEAVRIADARMISVRFSASCDVVFGTRDVSSTCGGIERLENGQWVERSPLSLHIQDRSLEAGEGELRFNYLTAPGKYRITYVFRKLDDRGYGAKIYRISHTFTIEESDEDFDLLAVNVYSGHVSLVIRPNTGKTIYQDYYNGKLERYVRGAWREVETPGGARAIEMLSSTSPAGYALRKANDAYYFNRVFYPTPKNGVFRITLYFCENIDGSGKQYALRLLLDLSGQ